MSFEERELPPLERWLPNRMTHAPSRFPTPEDREVTYEYKPFAMTISAEEMAEQMAAFEQEPEDRVVAQVSASIKRLCEKMIASMAVPELLLHSGSAGSAAYDRYADRLERSLDKAAGLTGKTRDEVYHACRELSLTSVMSMEEAAERTAALASLTAAVPKSTPEESHPVSNSQPLAVPKFKQLLATRGETVQVMTPTQAKAVLLEERCGPPRWYWSLALQEVLRGEVSQAAGVKSTSVSVKAVRDAARRSYELQVCVPGYAQVATLPDAIGTGEVASEERVVELLRRNVIPTLRNRRAEQEVVDERRRIQQAEIFEATEAKRLVEEQQWLLKQAETVSRSNFLSVPDPAQRAAMSAAWSAAVRTKLAGIKEAERTFVKCQADDLDVDP